MATDNERREVARMMRAIASGPTVKNVGLGEMLNSILTGGVPQPTTNRAIISRLADLIDPTCHAVHSDTAADDELVCSECGALVGVEREDGNLLFCSRYCECCGARVVIG